MGHFAVTPESSPRSGSVAVRQRGARRDWVGGHLPTNALLKVHFRFGGCFSKKICMTSWVCQNSGVGLSKWFWGFAHLALEVWQHPFRGLHTWLSRCDNVLSQVWKPVLLRWRASSSPLTGVGGCRAPKGSRSGNAGVVASCLTCGARACPRGSRGIGATRAVRSCPHTRGIAATCAVSKAHEKFKTPPGSRGGGEW